MLTLVEQIERQQPPCGISGHDSSAGAVMAANTRWNRLVSFVDPDRVEHLGVKFDAKAQFVAGTDHHRERVVVVFATVDLGDGQPVGAEQRGGVDRIVLVDENGVEQVFVAGGAVDLTERQVLMLKCVVVRGLQLVEQVGDRGGRSDVRPHRHRVDQQSHHRIRAGHLSGPPRDRGAEDDVATPGEPHQYLRPGALQHGVDGGMA